MKVKCPSCEESFELDVNEYDEGDAVDCPECGIALAVEVSGGKLKVVTEKERLMEEIDEEEFFDLD